MLPFIKSFFTLIKTFFNNHNHLVGKDTWATGPPSTLQTCNLHHLPHLHFHPSTLQPPPSAFFGPSNIHRTGFLPGITVRRHIKMEISFQGEAFKNFKFYDKTFIYNWTNILRSEEVKKATCFCRLLINLEWAHCFIFLIWNIIS